MCRAGFIRHAFVMGLTGEGCNPTGTKCSAVSQKNLLDQAVKLLRRHHLSVDQTFSGRKTMECILRIQSDQPQLWQTLRIHYPRKNTSRVDIPLRLHPLSSSQEHRHRWSRFPTTTRHVMLLFPQITAGAGRAHGTGLRQGYWHCLSTNRGQGWSRLPACSDRNPRNTCGCELPYAAGHRC